MLLFPSKKQLCFLPDARRKTNANQEHLVGIGIFFLYNPEFDFYNLHTRAPIRVKSASYFCF